MGEGSEEGAGGRPMGSRRGWRGSAPMSEGSGEGPNRLKIEEPEEFGDEQELANSGGLGFFRENQFSSAAQQEAEEEPDVDCGRPKIPPKAPPEVLERPGGGRLRVFRENQPAHPGAQESRAAAAEQPDEDKAALAPGQIHPSRHALQTDAYTFCGVCGVYEKQIRRTRLHIPCLRRPRNRDAHRARRLLLGGHEPDGQGWEKFISPVQPHVAD